MYCKMRNDKIFMNGVEKALEEAMWRPIVRY
jgi:hypothetical protein